MSDKLVSGPRKSSRLNPSSEKPEAVMQTPAEMAAAAAEEKANHIKKKKLLFI